MPVTPFHMGPGMFIKALLQGSFSLIVFGWAQVLMDIQPLVVLLTDNGKLHGFSHTYIGASLIAIIAGLSGKYLARFLTISRDELPFTTTWQVTFTSSFIGTFSHVILDSIMHSDIVPFYPLFFPNKMLEIISLNQLHLLCIYSGFIGVVVYYISRLFYQKTARGTKHE